MRTVRELGGEGCQGHTQSRAHTRRTPDLLLGDFGPSCLALLHDADGQGSRLSHVEHKGAAVAKPAAAWQNTGMKRLWFKAWLHGVKFTLMHTVHSTTTTTNIIM